MRAWWLGVWLVGCAGTPASTAPSAPREAPAAVATVPAPRQVLERRLHGATDTDPLVVLLHGRGHHPEGILPALGGLDAKVRVVAPRAPLPYGDGASWFSASAKDLPAMAAEVEERCDALATLIREQSNGAPVVVTGFSQGGILSFGMAQFHPDLVVGTVPIAGLWAPEVVPAQASAAQKATPIRAFHGEADPVLPLAATQAAVAAFEAAGFDVRLQTYPGVEHQISPAERAAWWATVKRLVEGGAAAVQ